MALGPSNRRFGSGDRLGRTTVVCYRRLSTRCILDAASLLSSRTVFLQRRMLRDTGLDYQRHESSGIKNTPVVLLDHILLGRFGRSRDTGRRWSHGCNLSSKWRRFDYWNEYHGRRYRFPASFDASLCRLWLRFLEKGARCFQNEAHGGHRVVEAAPSVFGSGLGVILDSRPVSPFSVG